MKDMEGKWREMSNALCAAAREAFPGHYVDTMPDPEDDGLFYVRVFGVADDGTYQAQIKLADALSVLRTDTKDFVFAPFVVSMSDTAMFYPEFKPVPPAEAAVATDVLEMLHDMAATPVRIQMPKPSVPQFEPYAGELDNGRDVPYAA